MIYFVGMDLHSNNVFIVIIDEIKTWVFKRKVKNDLEFILQILAPYREKIAGIVVESTFNWYWLVDGLMANGHKVHLAHPGAIGNYSGKKYTNDYTDAFHLADLFRKGELPEGYIYPKEDRPLRDLLRKRVMLVKSRTQHILSIENLVNRNLGASVNIRDIQKLKKKDLGEMFCDKRLVLSVKATLSVIKTLNGEIKALEKVILKEIKLKPHYKKILVITGIGPILAQTISLEVGDIHRFKKAGHYLSYCRCVSSKRISNEKKKGENNRKNGNKYLSWAYIEAANFAKRYCPYAKAFYNKKLKQTQNKVVARKALAAKIARACYLILKDDVAYDPARLFGVKPMDSYKGCGSKPKFGTGQNPFV
jgi:transposase